MSFKEIAATPALRTLTKKQVESLRSVKISHTPITVGTFFALDGAWDRKKVCVAVEMVGDETHVLLQNVGRIYKSLGERKSDVHRVWNPETGQMTSTQGKRIWNYYCAPVRKSKPVEVTLKLVGGKWENWGVSNYYPVVPR